MSVVDLLYLVDDRYYASRRLYCSQTHSPMQYLHALSVLNCELLSIPSRLQRSHMGDVLPAKAQPCQMRFHSLLVPSIMSVGEQALEDDPGVAPFVCGFTVGDDALAPGGQEWFRLMADEEICSGGTFFTMISMLGELYLVLHNTLYTTPDLTDFSPSLSKP